MSNQTDDLGPFRDPELTRKAHELVARITSLAHPPVDTLVRNMLEMGLAPAHRRIVHQQMAHYATQEAGR